MNTLFIIDGAGGAGKSDLIEYIESKYVASRRAAVVQKYSTRRSRPEEKSHPIDLIVVPSLEFDTRQSNADFFYYWYDGERYGFYCEDIDSALASSANVFIVVRDMNTIRRLSDRYRSVRVVPVFIYSDEVAIQERLHRDGYSRTAIAWRIARQRMGWNDYLAHPEIYEQVLINNSDRLAFARLIDSLIDRYSLSAGSEIVVSRFERFPLVRPLVGFKSAIEARLREYDRNVFVMMKYRQGNAGTYQLISKALIEHGFNAVRADHPAWQITGDTYNPAAVLYCCRYGIALFDEPESDNTFSPNVAYELGMMHLQLKECLILRHASLPGTPFDLTHKLYKPYTRKADLRKLVARWVEEVQQASRITSPKPGEISG